MMEQNKLEQGLNTEDNIEEVIEKFNTLKEVDTSAIEVNKNDKDDKKTKGYKLSANTREELEKLESNSGAANAEEFIKSLITSYKLLNSEDKKDDRGFTELRKLLTRIEQIYINVVQGAESSEDMLKRKFSGNLNLLNSQLEETREELEASEERANTYKSELNSYKTSSELEIKTLENTIKDKDLNIKSLEKDIQALDKSRKDTETTVTSLINEKEGFLKTLNKKEITISNLNSKINKLNSTIINNDKEKNELLKELSLYEVKTAGYESKINDMKDMYEKQLSSNEKQLEAYREQIKILTETLKSQ